MALFSLFAISCTGLGAVFGGLIENNPHMGWRWIEWIHFM